MFWSAYLISLWIQNENLQGEPKDEKGVYVFVCGRKSFLFEALEFSTTLWHFSA